MFDPRIRNERRRKIGCVRCSLSLRASFTGVSETTCTHNSFPILFSTLFSSNFEYLCQFSLDPFSTALYRTMSMYVRCMSSACWQAGSPFHWAIIVNLSKPTNDYCDNILASVPKYGSLVIRSLWTEKYGICLLWLFDLFQMIVEWMVNECDRANTCCRASSAHYIKSYENSFM